MNNRTRIPNWMIKPGWQNKFPSIYTSAKEPADVSREVIRRGKEFLKIRRNETMNALTKAEVTQKALAIWEAMDKNQKTGVRFGMFPAEVMRAAEAEGFNGRDLCSALMDCAKKDGGMRA